MCSVIFKTTKSDSAEALAPQNVTALHELTPDMALRMLQNRLTTPLPDAEQPEALHLLRELSYLPLAVAQAAACMNTSSMTEQQYQAQLDEHKEAPLEYSDDSSKDKLQESSLRNTVAAALSLSISQVRQSSTVAADYLLFVACVDRKNIRLNLLEWSLRREPVKMPSRNLTCMRSSPDDLPSQHSVFIDSSMMRCERGCRCRDGSKNGFNAQLHGCYGCFQTTITITEASGDDFFRTYSMFCGIVRRTRRRDSMLTGIQSANKREAV